jgi:hypothetical protein
LSDFESLLFANIRYNEERGSKESVISFAKCFKGCSNNRDEFTNKLIKGLPKNINEIHSKNLSERLFQNMKGLTKPPKSRVLGDIGRQHFYNVVNRYEAIPKLFKYKKVQGIFDGCNVPFVFEVAVGATNKLEKRKIAFGINNTITYHLPFAHDLFCPSNVDERDQESWQEVEGIREFLNAYRIGPDDPVFVGIHLISPNIRYENYGKSSFETGAQ